MKTIFITITLLIWTNLFCQKSDNDPLTFDLYEIQIFTGATIYGNHILKIDRNGMLLKKTDLYSMKDSEVELINFFNLKGSDLKNYRENFTKLLFFLNDFDFKNYKPLKEQVDTVIVDGNIRIRSEIAPMHGSHIRILIIDENMDSYFLSYQFCEEKLDELIDKVNNMIPKNLREKYMFRKICP